MQGITVAISLDGIEFFVKALLTPNGNLTRNINGVHLVDYTIPIQDQISVPARNQDTGFCSNINIQLSSGTITNFTPIFSSLNQQQKGVFQLVFSSKVFNANYSWRESYLQQNEYYVDSSDPTQPGYWQNDGPAFPVSTPFNYSPEIGSLTTTTSFTFTFDSTKNVWALPITSITAVANNPTANIPGNSILQNQDRPACVQSHVDAATEASIEQGINFQTAIQDAFGGYLTSIPASGNLTDEIVFTFGLGDSPLTFPNDQGLTVGATGISTYKGQPYPGTPPTGLPVPSVPTDHHLQMYVSNYAINGLYWAFALDGKLTSTVQPGDLNDPTVLDVSTYYNSIPVTDPLKKLLAPYRFRSMSATVTPQGQGATIQAPTVAFQTVYVFNPTTMKALQNVLPANVYSNLSTSSVASNGYTNTTDLESDLDAISIDSSYFATIEKTIEMLGAVVTHDLVFSLTVQGATIPGGDAPSLTFTLTRKDILTKLQLGTTTPTAPAKPAQTLQFTHFECQPPPVATLTASNFIPVNPTNSMYFSSVWNTVGEYQYSILLTDLGQTGVPLPIMEGFQFVFEQALLNLEQGYVGILSNVKFTS